MKTINEWINPATEAERDIKQHLQTKHRDGFNKESKFLVFGIHLRTKESTQLNIELGVYSANKGAHNMSRH